MVKLKQMKNNSMLIRTISGIVLLLIILVSGVLGGVLLLSFVEIVSLIGLYEFYRATGVACSLSANPSDCEKTNGDGNKKADRTFLYAGFIGIGLFYIAAALGGLDIVNLVVVFTVCMLVVYMGIYVFTFPKYNAERIAYAFLGFVYVVVFMSFVYFTRCLPDGKIIFWMIFVSSWVCDTCAYFSGTLLGKHKLAPVLSPKKSVEGAIGGTLGSMIVAFIVGYFIEFKLLNGADNSLKYVVMCMIGAVVSQIGDLAASAIKRNKNIKDYGNLIPGHGGVLDRFDSVIFVAPFVFMLGYFF